MLSIYASVVQIAALESLSMTSPLILQTIDVARQKIAAVLLGSTFAFSLLEPITTPMLNSLTTMPLFTMMIF
jgi:hypothetical protein